MHALHASLAAEYIALDSQEVHLSYYPMEVSQLKNIFIHADEDYDDVCFQRIARRLNTRYDKNLRFQGSSIFDKCTPDHLIYEIKNTGMASLAAARTLRVQMGEQTMVVPAVVYKLIHLIDDVGADIYFSVKHVLPMSGNICDSRSKYQIFYPASGEIFFDTEQNCFDWVKSLVIDLGLSFCVIYSFTKINPLLLQEKEKWREQEAERRIELASRPLPKAVEVKKLLKDKVAPAIAQDPIGMAVAVAKHLTHGTFLENIVEKTEQQIQAIKLKKKLKALPALSIANQVREAVFAAVPDSSMGTAQKMGASASPPPPHIPPPSAMRRRMHHTIQKIDVKIKDARDATSHSSVKKICGALHFVAKRTDEFVFLKKQDAALKQGKERRNFFRAKYNLDTKK